MIAGIEFKGEFFNHKEDYDLMDTLTENTIIICKNLEVKNILWTEVKRICDGECVEDGDNSHDYITGEQEGPEPKITKCLVNDLPTTRLAIDNNQIITFTIEAPFVLTAKSIMDLWFASTGPDNKISVWPMRMIEGSQENWNEGIEAVYHAVTQGKYGAYEGYWMNQEASGDATVCR